MIIDLGGVEPGDGKSRKDLGKQIGAGLGQFVEDQRAADGLRQDRQKAGASRWFQNSVIRRDRGSRQSGKAERNTLVLEQSDALAKLEALRRDGSRLASALGQLRKLSES